MTLTHLGGGRAAAGAQAALLGRGVLSYARIMVRQLQSDVRLEEQVELTRLEGAASGSADEDPLSATAVQVSWRLRKFSKKINQFLLTVRAVSDAPRRAAAVTT